MEDLTESRPFPYLAVTALCVGMLAHCIVFTAPLPFIAFMVVDFGMSSTLNSAGYAAGWIAGIFMIGRLVSGIPFGMVADKWGRKPCLLISMVNIAIFGIMFGFSRNYTMAIASRFLIGMGNGYMGISQTCISELVFTKEHEMKAFGYVNGIYGLGYVVGPAIGGILARPALQYPSVFHKGTIWDHYPYLLPNVFCAAIALIAGLAMFIYLPETLRTDHLPSGEENIALKSIADIESRSVRGGSADDADIEMVSKPTHHKHHSATTTIKTDNRTYGSMCEVEFQPLPISDSLLEPDSDSSRKSRSRTESGQKFPTIRDPEASPVPPESEQQAGEPLSVSDILKDPQLVLLLSINFIFSFASVTIEEVFPLWCVSSIARGGMSWSATQTGAVLAATGMGQVVCQFFLYHPIMKNFKDLPQEVIFYWQLILSAIPAMLMPLAEYWTMSSSNSSGSNKSPFLVAVVVVFFFTLHTFIVGTGFSTIAIVANASVSPRVRATMNGLTMTACSVGNFFAPVVGSSFFAFCEGLTAGGLGVDGRMVFVVGGAMLIALAYMVKIKFVAVDKSNMK